MEPIAEPASSTEAGADASESAARQLEPVTDDPDREPRWIADLFALWKREIVDFVTTAIALLVRPRRFGAEWSRGEIRAMPPIAFVLASATVLLPVDYGLQGFMQWDTRPNAGMAVEIARAAKPVVIAILTGLATHGVLRLLGTRRRMSSTVAILIYGMAISWCLWCIGLLVCVATGADARVPNGFALLSLAWWALALEGVHRIRWWWCACVLLGIGAAMVVGVNAVLRAANLT